MDYYKILGLERNATEQQIKKAYRKLAMKHHPDRNKGSNTSEEDFKKIGEAYATLSDPVKKREYDQKTHVHEGFDDFREHFTEAPDMDDFVNQFFRQGRPGRGPSFEDIFGHSYRPQTPTYVVTLNFWEAVKGVKKSFEIITPNNQRKEIIVDFPPAVEEGTLFEIQFEQQKIQIQINIEKDPYFKRDNLDLYTHIEIPLSKALLGGTLNFPHWERDYEIVVPSGTQEGQILRLSNAGIKKDIFEGDLYLTCHIILPKKLTKKQREILEEFAKTEKENTSFMDNMKNTWSKVFRKN